MYLYCRLHPAAVRLCFVAKPRGDVGYSPDGGVVEASLETDSARRSKPVRNADAEADVVSEPTPIQTPLPV